ncbi:hypothetical protein [Ammoniphilus sp. CFH 90114]|uniref:hypothetical protein n=1 Tax=Ammoniphilus sp. CFH 90114 TaxID=2493665 RepID=UPI00100F440D|nr:hypothetical protein [Ammoniphilus sp. CFH 90114]RXT03729.1 hypothetical protein EIZ39_23060 [Ammoniphilus sp. CFH 90114]
MKKFATLVSSLMMVVVLSACGTAGVQDVNDNYRGQNMTPYDTNLDNGMYTRPLKDSPLRNDPELTDNDGRVFDADYDDNMIDDEEMSFRPRR